MIAMVNLVTPGIRTGSGCRRFTPACQAIASASRADRHDGAEKGYRTGYDQ
jgi:hypothetical protein